MWLLPSKAIIFVTTPYIVQKLLCNGCLYFTMINHIIHFILHFSGLSTRRHTTGELLIRFYILRAYNHNTLETICLMTVVIAMKVILVFVKKVCSRSMLWRYYYPNSPKAPNTWYFAWFLCLIGYISINHLCFGIKLDRRYGKTLIFFRFLLCKQ